MSADFVPAPDHPAAPVAASSASVIRVPAVVKRVAVNAIAAAVAAFSGAIAASSGNISKSLVIAAAYAGIRAGAAVLTRSADS